MGEDNQIDSDKIEQKLKELEDRLQKDPDNKSLSKRAIYFFKLIIGFL
jgi:hypothetical protein